MTVSMRGAFIGGAVAGITGFLFGCLDPVGSNVPGYSPNLRTTIPPAITADKRLAPQIDQNDGLDGMSIALRSGFANGMRVRYWDLGTVSSTVFPPIWYFVRRGSDGTTTQIDHPPLVDSVPGDTGYSALRARYDVIVNAAWDGQQIASLQALDDASELGLVKKPVATGTYVNCPVALANVVLDPGDGEDPLAPTPVYYRDKKANCFDLQALLMVEELMLDKGKVPAPNAYLLRRQNETRVLDEVLWKSDLDGNGQTTDTNTTFEVAPDDMKYTGLWKQINVTVPSDYEFGHAQKEGDLFQRGMAGLAPIDGAVVDYQDPSILLNRPIYRVEAAP